VLLLKAGLPVTTTQGIYTPAVDEIWHSAAAYNALEQQLINAAAALAQQQAR
jgi:cytochrome c556